MPKSSPVTLTSIGKLLDQKLKQELSAQEKRFDTKLDQRFKANTLDLDQRFKTQRKDIVDAILKYIDKNIATKEKVNELKTQISHLPNKEEYYKKMDEYIKETKAFREEKALLPHQVGDIRTRVEKIEQHLGLATS